MSGLDLQEKLIQAKAVMDRVDGKPSNMNNTSRGLTESNPNLPPVSNNFNTESINNVINSNSNLEKPTVTEEKVKNSKLPDAIKQLMIDHPIPEVGFGNRIPDSLLEGAAEKMKSLSGVNNIAPDTVPPRNTNIKQSNKTQKITQSGLKSLIRETIKDSLGDLINEAISERMTESNKINESIKIIVGGTAFEGKITSTKKLN